MNMLKNFKQEGKKSLIRRGFGLNLWVAKSDPLKGGDGVILYLFMITG